MVTEKMKRVCRNCLIWILLLFTSSYPANSVAAFSIGSEREVGEKLLYSVRAAFPLVDDPDISQYLTRLGTSVLAVAGVQYFDYHFFVVDNKEFNAFAAPSGLLFFYSGLIATMQSEDELVSVLAHEVGHIAKRHLAERIEKGTYTSIASLGLALAALAFGGAATPVLLTGALATGQSMNLHFSRQHEEEADLLAYGWMKKMNRNPEAQATMLESMRRIARYRSDQLPQYLLTHPNPEARLHSIQSLLDIDRQTLDRQNFSEDDFDFLRFKYRILSRTQEARSFRLHLKRIAADEEAGNGARTMAGYGLALLAHGENDHDQALRRLEAVRTAYPEKMILLTDLGAFLFAAGRLSEAEKVLRQAVQADGNEMYAAFTLARLLSRTGRGGEAEEYFLRVSYELPEYAKVYFELGQLAADRRERGMASFFLGKYNLYEGKLTLAEEHLRAALGDRHLPLQQLREGKELLEQIVRLRK